MNGIRIAVNSELWDPNHGLYYDNDTIQTTESVHPQDGNSWSITSGIADSERAAAISTSLKNRWVRPYGSPAPEAGETMSPFASGFEVQAHYLAGFPERSEDLIDFMWNDFMVDDPRMTNSSFIEGYSTNGKLHYAPYGNDARISHAHGWATDPTSALTFLGVGLQVVSPAGKTWQIQPRLGNSKRMTAGIETPLGSFSANWFVDPRGCYKGSFCVPRGTSGDLVLPDNCKYTIDCPDGNGSLSPRGGAFAHLPGGSCTVSATA